MSDQDRISLYNIKYISTFNKERYKLGDYLYLPNTKFSKLTL